MIITVINEKPVSEKHISWFTKPASEGKYITLYEVVEQLYQHPQAPDEAVIPVLTTRQVHSALRSSLEGASLVLFEAAQTVIDGSVKCSL
ncbi:hypothetical protein LCGC14_0143120 [marine sediment metagenome]|uniref:Uncharacterized protein n=1 Tax=marine sediment metagenome TaxID=412755 RepID=A0A0F9V1D0_9ZZZZ